ncbi:cytochrome P450 [Xylariomycetidae sp. FL0641]|nr:cytochrome P450 [Xylariomycetidae sp. FL0641]
MIDHWSWSSPIPEYSLLHFHNFFGASSHTVQYRMKQYTSEEQSQATSWPRLLFCILFPSILICIKHAGAWDRPILPPGSPKLWQAYEWPVLGSALRFYSKRRDMVLEGSHACSNAIFSFYIGRKHVVSLGGLEGRKTFFENKDFSVSQGFVELLTGLVSSNEARDDYGAAFFVKCVASLSRAERLSKKLPILTGDARDFCNSLAAQSTRDLESSWRVTDITQSIYMLLYKFVHRSVGATEIAENTGLLQSTLHLFEKFERSTSLLHIIFPWLVTPAQIARYVAGARLYLAISKVLQSRDKEGRREEDALQYIYEQEEDPDKVIKFIFSALSSSVTMTGAATTWLATFLANAPQWQKNCREEVDAVVAKYRTHSAQSLDDVLATLTLQCWESEFPVLYACLQETLRLTSTGTFFRKNVSRGDIPIGCTGSVVPSGSYAAYLPDSTHLDPEIYPHPLEFDPLRFQDRKHLENFEQHTFVGWGSGRHLCAGMRIAKLEINIILVHLLANFLLELSDRNGRLVRDRPSIDRNMLRPEKSRMPVYIRYRLRENSNPNDS